MANNKNRKTSPSKNSNKNRITAIITVILIIAVFLYFDPSGKTIKDYVKNNPEEIANIVVDIVEGNEVDFTETTNSLNSTSNLENINTNISIEEIVDISDIPEWDNTNAYISINNNIPFFTASEKENVEPFEYYSELDNLGRCGVAYANICKELMPTEKREDIGSVIPSGWKLNGKSNNNEYDTELVEGGRIYNRCHLIGFQLAGENANKKNLITGTRYLNIEGMLPFENMIDDYVDETENHVLFRVTPIYNGKDLVPYGVQMEAWSVEDAGEGICFNVFAYNVQPGIEINYTTGENWLI